MKPIVLLFLCTLCSLGLFGCANHQASNTHDMGTDSQEMAHNETAHDETAHDEMTGRQAEVAELGTMVMPFDLDATTHIFEKIDTGGRQQVLVDDPADMENLKLIRSHLAEEAEKFAEGNFHDPQMIHGDAMPGLHELVMGANQLNIEYTEVPEGGQILYTTQNAELVQAIHMWFDAQLSDHGQHAQGHQ